MYLRRIILSCCILITNCGGGGGGGGIAGIDGSGSKVAVSETGAINGFGSVIVNGVHYDTDNAEIYIRGERAEEQELNVGDFVVVIGHKNADGESIADQVYYQPLVTGLIEAINQAQGTISVLGQTIILQDDTTFSEDVIPRNIEGLRVGQSVSVSGVSDDNQYIRATRLELTSTQKLDLFGKIDSVSDYGRTYKVNGITVDLSEIPDHSNHSAGDWVAVRGDEFSNGVFHADNLKPAMDYRELKTVKTIKINGFLKELRSNGNFFIDRVPVKVTEDTVFIGGTADDLAKNSSLQVEGALDVYHFLVADKITFKNTPDTQVYGHISDIKPAHIGEYYFGTIEVQGNTFKIDFLTRLVGDREERIGFHHLRVGDTALISGFYKNDKYVASAVTVDNRVFERYVVEMQGWAYAAVPEFKTFNLFNTMVKVDEDTKYTDRGMPISSEHCFELLSKGSMVQVRGHYEGYKLVATSVQVNPWLGEFGGGYMPPFEMSK